MAWVFGQLLFAGLAFLLGLLVGWLSWGRTAKPRAEVAEVAPVADLVSASPLVNPEPVAEAEPVVDIEPVADVKPVAETDPVAEAEPVVEDEPVAESEPSAEVEPVAVADPLPEPVLVAASADNFQRLEGIGPKISTVLVAAGIRTYRQLAACDQDTLNSALRQGGVRVAPSMSTWATQAELLAQGDEAGFTALTRQLVANRRSR